MTIGASVGRTIGANVGRTKNNRELRWIAIGEHLVTFELRVLLNKVKLSSQPINAFVNNFTLNLSECIIGYCR
jgi:hypothetical protein